MEENAREKEIDKFFFIFLFESGSALISRRPTLFFHLFHSALRFKERADIPDICHFFTRTKFLKNKIYTEKRQFFALNL